jgi:hypothetical protein
MPNARRILIVDDDTAVPVIPRANGLMRWLLPLLLAGCATAAPPTWIRVDGKPMTQEQFTLDQTICRGEMQKSNLTNTIKSGISVDANGVYDPKARAIDQVYIGCMAQHGYLQQTKPE